MELALSTLAAWYDMIDCPENGRIAVICSYCPDRRQAEKAARPLQISHGICPKCFPKAMAEAAALSDSVPQKTSNPN